MQTYGALLATSISATSISGRVAVSTGAATITSSAITPDNNTYSQINVTVDAGLLTSNTLTINAPSGTANDGQKLIIRIKNTSASAIAMILSLNSIYQKGATTVNNVTATKTDYLGFIYNATNTKWDLVAYIQGL